MRTFTIMVAMIVAATSAAAGPCEDAKKGTYLSNVCWLIEGLTSNWPLQLQVMAADQETCTVTFDRGLAGNWVGDEQTIYFERSDGNLTTNDEWTDLGWKTCWSLQGEKILEDPNDYTGEIWTYGQVEVCGSEMGHDRIREAMANLFTKYCSADVSEF